MLPVLRPFSFYCVLTNLTVAISGEEFLATFPSELIEIIAEGIAQLFTARQVAIKEKRLNCVNN